MEFNFKEISKKFKIEGEMVSCEPYGEGHINLTFLLITDKAKYILHFKNLFINLLPAYYLSLFSADAPLYSTDYLPSM